MVERVEGVWMSVKKLKDGRCERGEIRMVVRKVGRMRKEIKWKK